MTSDMRDCPCNGCVPPRRHPHCHSTCPDYPKWSELRAQRNAKVAEIKEVNNLCFPNKLRSHKRGKMR